MAYIDFNEKQWKAFQGSRIGILKENLWYTTDPEMRSKLQETISALEAAEQRRLERKWWQFWK